MAHCSTMGVSVAGTPPCSAIRFCKEIAPRNNDRGVARWARQGLKFAERRTLANVDGRAFGCSWPIG